jgi:glycosyltransferase involved in cell wall biosynthesis
MPAGINTEIFKKDENISKVKNSSLFIGRFSPIKNIELLIEAVKLLHKEGLDFILNIVGESEVGGEKYFNKLKELSKELESLGKIKFLGKIPNYKTPEINNKNEVSVNLSPAGLFDKSILEAMACETLVLVSSPAFKNILPPSCIFSENDSNDLKDKMINLFNLDSIKKRELEKELREIVIKNHNLDILVGKLINEFQK